MVDSIDVASPSLPAVADSGLSRRTVVAGAVWTVPAIVLMSASPALAVSSALLTVSTPNLQVPAAGTAKVTASLKNSSGLAVSGAAVSFSGPSGASFTPASATTDGSGNATTTLDLGTPWVKPGAVVTLNATSGSETKSQPVTVLGSNLVVAGSGYTSTPSQTELVVPASPFFGGTTGAPTGFTSPVVSAAAGSGFFMVLLQNGTVWAKGSNDSGQLGDGSTTSRSTWVPVSGLSGVTQIAAGTRNGYALLSSGSMMAWGGNNYGQIGDGTPATRTKPTQVFGLTSGVTQIASSGSTDISSISASAYALLSDGSMVAWGLNNYGQLGDGTQTLRNKPVPIPNFSGVTQIAAGGRNGYAVRSDGSAWAWGVNNYGQIGDNTSGTNHLTPTQVSGLSAGVTQITAGMDNGYALLSDGRVKAWGVNNNGQIGDDTGATNHLTPTQVSGLSAGVTQIAAGAATGYALLSDGSVKAWGANNAGQVGDSTTTNRLAPVAVKVPTGRIVQSLGTSSPSSSTALLVMTTP